MRQALPAPYGLFELRILQGSGSDRRFKETYKEGKKVEGKGNIAERRGKAENDKSLSLEGLSKK